MLRHLKKWAGLYRSSDVGTLFRKRSHLGLQLTSLEFHFEHLQLVKCCLLESSSDETVREIYQLRKERLSKITSRWSATNELKNLESIVDHNLKFAGQTDRAGLGSKKDSLYIANPSNRQLRTKTTAALATSFEEKHTPCFLFASARCLDEMGKCYPL